MGGWVRRPRVTAAASGGRGLVKGAGVGPLPWARRAGGSRGAVGDPRPPPPGLPERWDVQEPLLEGLGFALKYLGMTLVDAPKGEDMAAAAIRRILATVSRGLAWGAARGLRPPLTTRPLPARRPAWEPRSCGR